jgi:hypothetical protein
MLLLAPSLEGRLVDSIGRAKAVENYQAGRNLVSTPFGSMCTSVV